jgi:UDP-N-acetylglucosamine kinase
MFIKDAESFSTYSQIFSNVFTDELINIAGDNKYNIIVEGTMRNTEIVENTASFFKEKGFSVEAHEVVAHPTITELNL